MLTLRLRSCGALMATAALLACETPTDSSDATAPQVALVSPAAGALNLSGAVTVTASASDSAGITSVDFALDGTIFASDDAAPYEGTLPNTAGFASGAHTISVRATDANGNRSEWTSVPVTFAGTVPRPSGFSQTTFAEDFGSQVTALVVAPDGRVFVAEKDGAIRVVRDGVLSPTPFATLTVASGSERGLLGLALSPDFANTGYLYAYYTTTQGGAHNRISRFAALGDAAVTPEEVLVDLPALSSAENHNGGALAFGPDGKLYVAVGDNANGSLAPSLGSPFGKILRYNADGSIPGDNPFAGQTSGGNRAIWARGLRNPYSMAFHPTTGRLHINDVGESSWEEINLGRAGADYGWPSTEGSTTASGVDTPLFAYGHAANPTLITGSAIIGAAFYAPAANRFGTAFAGDYLFADYGSGVIYRMDVGSGAVGAFASTGAAPTALAITPEGSLLVAIGDRIDRITR